MSEANEGTEEPRSWGRCESKRNDVEFRRHEKVEFTSGGELHDARERWRYWDFNKAQSLKNLTTSTTLHRLVMAQQIYLQRLVDHPKFL